KISEGHSIIVPATSGRRTLAQATDMFTGHLDPDFKNWGTDVAGEARPETPADVYEQIENATFADMFTSLSSNLDQLLWEQEQILAFVESHRNWLRPQGYGNFFLFKVGSSVFVAGVFFYSDGTLIARVDRFDDDDVWVRGRRHRVIVPQFLSP
ncbi:MAG: hypothetical protein Q8Q23_05605, partial [bacterium]|nr:hypothetical protein [bacterium]